MHVCECVCHCVCFSVCVCTCMCVSVSGHLQGTADDSFPMLELQAMVTVAERLLTGEHPSNPRSYNDSLYCVPVALSNGLSTTAPEDVLYTVRMVNRLCVMVVGGDHNIKKRPLPSLYDMVRSSGAGGVPVTK